MGTLVNETIAKYYHTERFELIHLKNCPREYKLHSHASTYTVGILIYGNALLTRASEERILAGDYFVISPYQAHSLVLQGSYELLSLCINKALVQTIGKSHLLLLFTEAISSCVQNISEELLIEIVEELCAVRERGGEKSKIAEDIRLIEEHPERTYPLPILARRAFINKTSYIELFKMAAGVTPHSFQLQSKIRRAQRALENGKEIASLAVELGFYDQSHFHKCFKDIVGMTPGKYRKSVIAKCM